MTSLPKLNLLALGLIGLVACASQSHGPNSRRAGQLSNDDIFAVLRENSEAVKVCRERHKASSQSRVIGEMRVGLIVDPDGRTRDVAVSPPNFEDTVLAECMLSAVRSWTFPPFTGRPAPVSFPVRSL